MNLFKYALAEQLSVPLPGREVQFRMAPYRRPKDLNFQYPSDAKQSAVLISFYFKEDEPHFILMKRSEYKGPHSGQICFPGGALESQDVSLLDTALRESMEEIGVDPNQVEVLGRLSSLFIPVSYYKVQPYIACLPEQPTYVLDPQETAAVIEVPLSELMNDACEGFRPINHRGEFTLDTPCIELQGHIVWGATAMMIAELKAVISQMGV